MKGVGSTKIQFYAPDLRNVMKCCGACVLAQSKKDLPIEYIMVEGYNIPGDIECTAVGCSGYAMSIMGIEATVIEPMLPGEEKFRLLFPPFKIPKNTMSVTIDDNGLLGDKLDILFTISEPDGVKEVGTEQRKAEDPRYFPDWRKVWPSYGPGGGETYKIRMDPKVLMGALEAMKDEDYVNLYFGSSVQPLIMTCRKPGKKVLAMPMRSNEL